jgi:glutamine synthetase
VTAASNTFADRCGIDTPERRQAIAQTMRLIEGSGIELVRFAWCDQHGMLRCKTLVARAALAAMQNGVGLVSTLLLKDTADRTAYNVFAADGGDALPGYAFAPNVLLMADPGSFKQLPWADRTGWLQCQPYFADGTPVGLDTRRILQAALAQLAHAGFGLTCGLEVEFHIYKRVRHQADEPHHYGDPMLAAWPGPAPQVELVHPGYHMLSEQWTDQADEPLRIVQRTAQALGLPLLSLEIEFGPSQVEAVFSATDALQAADNMVLFRSAMTQALRRAGYHATFMCRPPFPHILSSGWHLHQSLTDLATKSNAMMRSLPASGSTPADAAHTLSDVGEHYLAGLLLHAKAMTALAVPSIDAYARFQPNALAPQSVTWGSGNRGAMLRVVGAAGDADTRIENRLGVPSANPYLYIASQIYAGLDGITRQLRAPPATHAPYAPDAEKLPTSLTAALTAWRADAPFAAAFGPDFIDYFSRIKQSEIDRHASALDETEWFRREYFARI